MRRVYLTAPVVPEPWRDALQACEHERDAARAEVTLSEEALQDERNRSATLARQLDDAQVQLRRTRQENDALRATHERVTTLYNEAREASHFAQLEVQELRDQLLAQLHLQEEVDPAAAMPGAFQQAAAVQRNQQRAVEQAPRRATPDAAARHPLQPVREHNNEGALCVAFAEFVVLALISPAVRSTDDQHLRHRPPLSLL